MNENERDAFNILSYFYLLINRTEPMKKPAYLLALITIAFTFLTGCKEDSTAPDINIIGDAHVITQKGTAYFDMGAEASDDKDDAVYVISDVSYNNPKHPNTDIIGDYTITYTAQDRAGNISTATRVVSVTNTQGQLYHNYNVTDICLNDTLLNTSYTSSTIIDTNYVYRTFFTNMSNFFSGLTYMDPAGTSITIPKQKPDGIFSPFVIEGSGTISDSAGITYKIIVNYTITDTTNTFPMQTRHAVFVSF
jgi:hypothetical protein